MYASAQRLYGRRVAGYSLTSSDSTAWKRDFFPAVPIALPFRTVCNRDGRFT